MKAIIIILSMFSSMNFQTGVPGKVLKNMPPQADAGADFSIQSKEIVQLDGTSSREPDGIISRYQWTQIAGAAVVIANPNAAITGLSGYVKGDYSFRLTVTDEKGAISTDEIKITIQE